MKTLLQATLPVTVQEPVAEPTVSPITPPLRALGRRTKALGAITSTPKRLKLESREPSGARESAEVVRVKVSTYETSNNTCTHIAVKLMTMHSHAEAGFHELKYTLSVSACILDKCTDNLHCIYDDLYFYSCLGVD